MRLNLWKSKKKIHLFFDTITNYFVLAIIERMFYNVKCALSPNGDSCYLAGDKIELSGLLYSAQI